MPLRLLQLTSLTAQPSFRRSVAGTFVRQLASGGFSLVTITLIARILGPAGSGTYAVALLLPTLLATFLNFGTSSANVYYLASRQVDARTAITVTALFSALSGGLGLVIGAVVATQFGASVFPGVALSAVLTALASFPFMLLLQAASGLLQGFQDFRAFNLGLLAPPIATLAMAVFMAVTGRLDINAALACILFGHVVGVAAMTPQLVRRWRGAGEPAMPKRQYFGHMLTYGLKAYASNVVTYFNYRADLFLVNWFLGPTAAGTYVIATQFGEKLWLLSQAVSTVFLPKVSELAGNEAERRRLTARAVRWTFGLTLLAAIVLAGSFGFIIDVLMGEAFSGAHYILLLLLPGIVLWAPARILSNNIAGRGRPEVNLYVAVLVMSISLVGTIGLVPVFGVTGAAISTSIAYTIMYIVTFYAHHRFNSITAVERL